MICDLALHPIGGIARRVSDHAAFQIFAIARVVAPQRRSTWRVTTAIIITTSTTTIITTMAITRRRRAPVNNLRHGPQQARGSTRNPALENRSDRLTTPKSRAAGAWPQGEHR